MHDITDLERRGVPGVFVASSGTTQIVAQVRSVAVDLVRAADVLARARARHGGARTSDIVAAVRSGRDR